MTPVQEFIQVSYHSDFEYHKVYLEKISIGAYQQGT